MEEIHDAGKLSKLGAEIRKLEQQYPRSEQTPEDKGLEDQP